MDGGTYMPVWKHPSFFLTLTLYNIPNLAAGLVAAAHSHV